MAEASIPIPSGRPARPAPRSLLALRSDEHLVARIRRGDEGAFEVLYERHARAILSYCRHMLGNQEEAEDAVQHAFASAHSALLRDQRRIDFKPWLYAIARNRSLSLLRARREQESTEREISTEGLADDVRRRADLRELVADLHDLPSDQREALVLTELGDLSQAQVAELLGCQVSNVKGLIFRARAGLAERRDARSAPCEEIRAELATARRGTLRKGRLRHHLKDCLGCSAYLEEVRRQRRMMALLLPVVPSVGLKRSVLAACGLGGTSGAGGAAVGAAGLAAGGAGAGAAPVGAALATKLAVAATLAGSVALGGGAVVGHQAGDHGQSAAPAAVKNDRPAPEAKIGPAGRRHPSARPVHRGTAKGRSAEGGARHARAAHGRAKQAVPSHGLRGRAAPRSTRVKPAPPGQGGQAPAARGNGLGPAPARLKPARPQAVRKPARIPRRTGAKRGEPAAGRPHPAR